MGRTMCMSREVAAASGISNPDLIYPGDQICCATATAAPATPAATAAAQMTTSTPTNNGLTTEARLLQQSANVHRSHCTVKELLILNVNRMRTHLSAHKFEMGGERHCVILVYCQI